MHFVLTALLWFVFASAFMWLMLMHKLFKILAEGYPAKYKEMGKPRFFWHHSPRSALVLMRFLFSREYMGLGNPKLSDVCNSLLVFFVLYNLGILSLLIIIPLGYAT